MKKLLFAAALFAGTITGAAAQTNALKVNLLSPLVRTGSFFFEHQLARNQSLQLGGLYTHWSVGDTKITGFAFTPEYRFYLSRNKPALHGFYLAPFLRYQTLTLTVTDAAEDPYSRQTVDGKATLNTFGGGLVVGHQWVFSKRVTLDTFIGPSCNGGILRLSAGSASANFDAGPFTGFGVRTGLTLGLAF